MFHNPFVQSITLLLLTAVLTGLLVPYLLKVVDDRKLIRQQEREAALARQSKIIDAQSNLLDDLTQQLWRWRYLCIRVTYYGGQARWELLKQAEEDYEREIWDALNSIRNGISRSRHLVTEDAYQKLLAFYKHDILVLESKITSVRREEHDIDKRAAFLLINQQIFDDVTTRIDQMLKELAEEMQLAGPSST